MALHCTFSISLMSIFIWGDHTDVAYSRIDMIQLALLTCSVMCMLKLSLSSNMIPRSFS